MYTIRCQLRILAGGGSEWDAQAHSLMSMLSMHACGKVRWAHLREDDAGCQNLGGPAKVGASIRQVLDVVGVVAAASLRPRTRHLHAWHCGQHCHCAAQLLCLSYTFVCICGRSKDRVTSQGYLQVCTVGALLSVHACYA
jgi:hypothetical protein